MDEYQALIADVLRDGTYRQSRTGVDTVSTFSHHYTVDLAEGYPLLTTKEMDTFRWESMLREVEWYLSGEHHVRTLAEHTGIWDAWADDEGNLPTAYGRFWRRFPVPARDAALDGEWWPRVDADWIDWAADHYDASPDAIRAALDRWVADEAAGEGVAPADETAGTTFDQLRYVVDTLRGDNPMRPPESRRLVVSAWHPANADVSRLPPCHYTFVFSARGDRLDCHLTQRSGDVALGVPFNVAAYALLQTYVARLTGYEPGTFSHQLVDAHVYAGRGERGAWYADNLEELQRRLANVEVRDGYRDVRRWLLDRAPPDEAAEDPANHQYGYDHVPGLLEQLAREPLDAPTLSVEPRPLDEFGYDDVALADYESHGGLGFAVAE
ncbi:MAG: thymidylate synthase [Halobacteriaceae archaeon]